MKGKIKRKLVDVNQKVLIEIGNENKEATVIRKLEGRCVVSLDNKEITIPYESIVEVNYG